MLLLKFFVQSFGRFEMLLRKIGEDCCERDASSSTMYLPLFRKILIAFCKCSGVFRECGVVCARIAGLVLGGDGGGGAQKDRGKSHAKEIPRFAMFAFPEQATPAFTTHGHQHQPTYS